jgi:hypothetical protein
LQGKGGLELTPRESVVGRSRAWVVRNIVVIVVVVVEEMKMEMTLAWGFRRL